MLSKIENTIKELRRANPLVHNITNRVVTNITANALLAIQASPLMAEAEEELEEIISISNTLVINIGTLNPLQISAMKKAVSHAKKLSKAYVLDPVGAGSSKLRTNTAMELIELYTPAIVRCNSSEMLSLAYSDKNRTPKGVDSSDSIYSALESAKSFAFKNKCVTSVSGAFDFITDGKNSFKVEGKSSALLPLSLITQITGTGCVASAVSAACLAVAPSLIAATTAMAMLKEAQVQAITQAKGPASLEMHFIDALYNLDPAHAAQWVTTLN